MSKLTQHFIAFYWHALSIIQSKNNMKEKQYDPAGHNEESPAEGMAAVNTHNPEEKESLPQTDNQHEREESIIRSKPENDKNNSEN